MKKRWTKTWKTRDGTLPEAEKEALRKMVLVDVLGDHSQETGDEEVLGSEQGSSEEHVGSNEALRIATLRQIIEECCPMSLRHRQAARVLEKRLDDNERMQERHREEHRRRQQQLMARGVTREHAQLLAEDASDPLPTPIMEDLADFRRQSLREELVSRRTKAREAFQGPWLQSTERELHETTVKLLTIGVDSKARASLEAYQLLLQEKLKQHHQNQGFNSDCQIALEERKRACVALGLLREEQQDLVTTLFQILPTVDELGEPPELASQNATPPPVDNRDLKILDAAAFRNAVTSERAWVVTATFAREIPALRFALCKRSPKHVTTKAASVRDSLISGSFAMMSFKKTRELLAGSYLADIISDEEFVLLYDCRFSKNLELRYEQSFV